RRFDLWKSTAFAKLLVFNAQPFTFRERVGESLFNGKTHLVKLLKSEVKCDSKQSFRGAIARCVRVNRDSMVCRRSARQSIAGLAFCFGCAIYFLETGRKSGFSPLG